VRGAAWFGHADISAFDIHQPTASFAGRERNIIRTA
jgi:hypothetical protein